MRALQKLLPLALLLAPTAAAQSRMAKNDYDRVVLKDGKELEGRVLFETDELVVVRQGKTKERELPRAEVAEVRSVERSLAEFMSRIDRLQGPDDLAGIDDLARFAAENGLPGEARLAWLFALTRDPEDAEAWEGLGGRKSSRGWELESGGRWRTLEDFREHHSTWKNKLELRSTHFVLESDLALEDSIRLLVTMEDFYQAFYAVMTPTVRLYPVTELPLIQVTKDRSKYPVPPLPRDAWFAVPRNTLNICAETELDMGMVIREFTTGLIYNAFYNTTGKSGVVAPWVGRGLAEWFAGSTQTSPFRVDIDVDRENTALFRRHAEAKEPLSLKRLFTLTHGEFETGPAAELGAAQAYTLLHFLARGAERKYRAGLLAYADASYHGKGSLSNFEKLVTKDLGTLEAEWRAYVAERAGS